jgi:two-component system CheB/CheR fusion protein
VVSKKETKKNRSTKAPDTTASNTTIATTAPPGSGFAVVGIGASAGGLAAFEQFFRHVPPESGMAFVLVPHLDPGHDSILSEILQRATDMPVVEAEDQLRVVPNHVYVIPPNRDMAIFHGALQLSVPEQPRGHRMPIDTFLRTLADDQGERAVGIILSGTGTDGTLGLRAILGAGGITLVQEPSSAAYDGMPSSAIQAGYATHILPPEKIPEALLRSEHHLTAHPHGPSAPAAVSGMNRILLLLRTATGHDFSLYKKSTIGRRIERRMAQHNIESMEVYARYLKENPGEIQALFKELLINVTSFFRDPEAFVALEREVLPQLLAGKGENYVFRIWVAGCATGEEAYSLAILLREYMNEQRQEFKVQLYATDLDDEAIAVARAGLYPPNIMQDVSPERLRRFFVKDEGGYRIKKEIREMVVFAVQNAIKDPPFTRLDLLSCRNLMIYLETELQNRLIPIFHYALKPGGVLFLSSAESIGSHPELFTPLSRKWKLYQAAATAASARSVMSRVLSWEAGNEAKVPEEVMKKRAEPNFAELTRQQLLQAYAPASVVTDLKGNIIYVHGETGKYLRPAPGQATLNVVEMARDGLQLELRLALQKATQGDTPLSREVALSANGDSYHVNLSIRPLAAAELGQGLLLVSFQDIATPPAAKPEGGKTIRSDKETLRIAELERELAYSRENLQATVEQQQASNEELKSTNEELQSTNEELQSTNEELETSKEELQSVNEELSTVNAEFQAKIEQLTVMQNDMKNLLDNINIGTIFLDQQLCIRRFTRDASKIYRLVATDIKRPLADIKSDIQGEELLLDAQRVLETLVPSEREVQTSAGAHYLARIQPYRTLDNIIDGVVLTFTDISLRIAAEEARLEAAQLAEGVVNTVREPLLVLDDGLKVVTASHSFYQRFQVTPESTLGRPLYELGNRQWDIPSLRKLLDAILQHDQPFEDYVVEHDFPTIGHQRMLLNARRINTRNGRPQMILLAIEE